METLLLNWEGQLRILLDILIAVVLCSAIGQERESVEKPAGLRTNMIIGGISCFFISISTQINNYLSYSDLSNEIDIDTDPIRILQAILVGISFIGAGTVWKSNHGSNVKYLTTAATLLFSSGVGIAVALHAYIMSVGLTLIILFINHFHKIKGKV